METHKIQDEMMDALMYAEMDEEEFWKTSTISSQEASEVAKAWSLIYDTRIKSEKKQKEFAKRFASVGENEK